MVFAFMLVLKHGNVFKSIFGGFVEFVASANEFLSLHRLAKIVLQDISVR